MQAIPNNHVCPTCGQPLINDVMLRHVEHSQATVERLLRAKLTTELETKAAQKVEAAHAGRDARAKARMDELQRRVEELQRQLDTRSAHDRGVDHERDVLVMLRSAFPSDRIDRHGRRGDILHTVLHGDREIGRILIECKNAGAWQNAWLAKLKQDGRRRGTPYLVLVTRRMPAKAGALCVRDQIAVCEPAYVVAVATIVRQWVVGAHRGDTAAKDMPEKARRLYDYLAGDEFRASFDETRDCVNQLDAQDEAERSQHERTWDKRAKLHGQLRAAQLRIGAKLGAEIESAPSQTFTPVVADIPKRGERRAA